MLARQRDLRLSVAAKPILPGKAERRSGQERDGQSPPGRGSGTSSREATVDSDSVLMARLADGEDAAFRILIDRHLAAVLGLARRLLGETSEAEDVAQETMLRLWRTSGQLDVGAGGVRGWLLRVARNLCIDRRRASQRVSVVEEVPEEIDPPKQLVGIEAAEVSASVESAMLELPERQRTALLLFHHEGLSLVEIGREMDISSEAVESLLARGRRGLRQKLAGVWRQLLDLEPEPDQE